MRNQANTAQHCILFLLLIATALMLGACQPRGGTPADIVARHFEVVPAGTAEHPELIPKITLRNPSGSFGAAARNLHDDCGRAGLASLQARVNGVDVYWAPGVARVAANDCILLVTGDEQGNASATATGENAAAYAVAGAPTTKSTD